MKSRTAAILGSGAAAAAVLLGLLAGFVPQDEGPVLRRRVSTTTVRAGLEDIPAAILPLGDGTRQWAVRGEVHAWDTPDRRNAPAGPDPALRAVVSFGKAGVILSTAEHPLVFEHDAEGQFSPLLPVDGASVPLLMANQPRAYGDVLDAQGHPLRWHMTEAAMAGYRTGVSPKAMLAFLRRAAQERELGSIRIQVSPGSARFREVVEDCARRYNLSSALVYAIIHSESNFSTTLVSNRSAMGLMQILPGTASGEIHRYLYGRSGAVGFAELAQPETNIRYGTAYLHILLTRYFGGVRDALAREYCVVAAYNMGPNRLLRFYGRTNAEAVAAINALSPEDLYADLISRLPSRETRHYVAKVQRAKMQYAAH